MKQDDLLVEVRDKSLSRVGTIPADLLLLEAENIHNNVGTWKLQLGADHPLADVLSTPGAGLIVTGPTDVLFSGPVTRTESAVTATDPLGTLTVEGVDDTVILADMLAWPQPSNGDAATQTVGTDDKTDAAETLMHYYVSANCGPNAPAARRRAGLTLGTNGKRGGIVSKSPRFQPLGELCKELAEPNNLGFRIVQRGPQLVFETYAVADRTKDTRLGVVNNTLAGQRTSTSTPQKTRVIVGGDGDGSHRVVVPVDNPGSIASEADWGRRIERFIDERSSKDTAELTQKGTEALADGGATLRSAQAVPMEDSALTFGKDWGLGDRVTVIVGGTEMAAVVTGMVLKVTEDGYRLGAALGDPAPLSADAAAASAHTGLESRVSSLERTAEATPPGPRVISPSYTGITQATPPSGYPQGETVQFYLSAEASTVGGWDFAGKWGIVETQVWAGGDALQTWRRVHSGSTSHEVWVRGGQASGWSPWRQTAFEHTLTPTSVTQSSLPSAYPFGTSTLVLESAEAAAGGWAFGTGSRYGVLRTIRPASATYAHQTWLRLSPTVTEEWTRSGSSASGWTAWRTSAHNEKSAKGVVAMQELGTTPYVGDSATVVYTQQFTAEAGRCYKVALRVASVDTDGTGDHATLRYAKQTAYTTVRWASGTSVTTNSRMVGDFYSTTFDDDSLTSTGLDMACYINNPPPGPVTIGVTLYARRPAATYGQVRFLPGGLSTLVVEDAGAAL
ncbi:MULTISPECIES: siphovirus ReqiPepy6 Gp37-like family protein [Streptomyces]|uniref:siphovirus ReqiPepy6 Gp37-like family protein n=1 Tax=Streptomyces TaxID=1883 RepID=UPI002E2A48ED|nr:MULTISPECIES: siphovirus ReqiPepy6 Gp37-like family protein [Streptomyces]